MYSPYSPGSDTPSDIKEVLNLAEYKPMDFSDSSFKLPVTNPISLKGLTDKQLVSLSARDLNRLCRDMPNDVIKQLKKRRRTLKNRGYALTSRIARISRHIDELETEEVLVNFSLISSLCMYI